MFPSKEIFRSAVLAVIGGIITVVILKSLKFLEIRDEDELNEADKQPQENEERSGNEAEKQPQENDERLGWEGECGFWQISVQKVFFF